MLDGKVTLELRYVTREARWGMDPLFELGFDEVDVPVAGSARNQWVRQQHEEMLAGDERGAAIQVQRAGASVVLTGVDWRYVLDTRTGLFRELSYRNHQLLTEPMTLSIWRAPTDNDRTVREEWERAQYHLASARAYRVSARAVASSGIAQADAEPRESDEQGAHLSINAVELRCAMAAVAPVVHGIRMMLPRAMRNVVYCGYGPGESYVDTHRACWHGMFDGTPPTLGEREFSPQENGNRHDCDWARVAGDGVAQAAPKRAVDCADG